MQLDDATVLVPWPVSGRSTGALRAQAGRLHTHQTDRDDDPVDVAWSLATTRAALPRRAVVVAAGRAERLGALSALEDGRSHPSVVSGLRRGPGRAAMIFPGQGSQWAGMGLALRDASPAFARRFDECAAALSEFVSWDPVAVLRGSGDTGLDEVDVVQPMLWAVMVSLAAAWSERGVEPVAVVGHSQGEIAAATVAGALDLSDAARVVALRSKIIRRELAGRGSMMSLPCSVADAEALVAPWGDDIEIAAVNGPESTVVCGPAELVDPVLAAAEARGLEGRRIQVDYASHSRFVETIRDDILDALAPVRPRSSRIAFHSTVTAGPFDTAGLDADYWYQNLRQTVRFADAVRGVLGAGVDLLLEASPHPLLRNGMQEIVDNAGDSPASVVGTLRRDDGGLDRWTRALAEAWIHGAPVDWRRSLPADPEPQVVDLPTYAFRHQRYWINVAQPGNRLTDVGQETVDHPLLGAAIDTGAGGLLLTGRLSRTLQPWLCGHAVDGSVVVPGTLLVEAAVRAGDQVGTGRVEELTLPAPLVLPETGGVALRVEVGPADGNGSREVAVLARPDGEDAGWTRHAEGRLNDGAAPDAAPSLAEWPPQGAVPVDTAEAYDDLAARGYGYDGPFRGLRAAWRCGNAVYAEVALPDDADAGRFTVHPALLDAAMHAEIVTAGADDAMMLPFAWTDVVVHSTGATALRVRSTPLGGGSTRIEAFDGTGAPVVTVGSVLARPAERGPARAAAPPVYRVRWSEADPPPGTGPGADLPDGVAVLGGASDLAPGAPVRADLAAPAAGTGTGNPAPGLVIYRHEVAEECFATDPDGLRAVLELVRTWVTDPVWAGSRLAVVTRGGVDVGGGPHDAGPVPAAAAVCGLVRAAGAEHPGRIVLVDEDGRGPDGGVADDLVVRAAGAGHPEVALRDGRVLTPLVERVPPRPDGRADDPATDGADGVPVLDPDGTVLVTGGLSGLGALTARRLVERYGARTLLLTGRRGADTPGAAELVADLERAGADITVAACDVADRGAVDGLLALVPHRHPLTAVVHAAGVLDDGVIESLTPERLDRVMAPKIDGAWHLHDGTRDADLRAFVVLSSAAGVLGAAGQSNYAAANSAVDALVAHRRAAGLPAVSLRWGLWADSTGMTGAMSDDDIRRLSRQGFPPMSTELVLRLLDEALACAEPAPLLLRLDRPALRAQADARRLPAILEAVAGPGRRRGTARDAGADSFPDTLARTPEGGRRRLVLDLVRASAAEVLGHATPDAIEGRTPFRELGVDSLTSLELRRALNAETGLTLPATVLFDHGTPDLLAAHVHGLLTGGHVPGAVVAPRDGDLRDDPIVVVGTACRFPRGIDTPEAFWELLAGGGTVTGAFPTDRGWDVDGIYDPRPGVPGRTYTTSGGFLDAAGDFDAGFFGMSPVDADRTDPQQRILLETSWEAFERAGIDPDTLRGRDVGVFAGAMYHDYPHSSATGSIVSGLLSYTYGFEGPAMTVDTACSSSLVSLHLAMRSLRTRECSLALVTGVTVMATPEVFLEFGLQQGLSPDGRCRSFTAAADGTGFSEGAVSLVVARLSDARRDGLPVLAVLAGSAVNQDGASNGLTAPSMSAQCRLLASALHDAGLAASEVDVVEGHGTGTPLGDPIEIGAVVSVFDGDRPEGRALRLGSVKSNLGHMQATAGLAGVLKTVLALRHGVFPAQGDPGEPTTAADWGTGGVVLAAEPMPWEPGARPRRAGVSSFGISGTNAHVVVAEPPPVPDPDRDDRAEPSTGPVPILVSGASEPGLRAQCRVLAEHLEAHPGLAPADVATTLATARAALRHRAAVVVDGGPDGARTAAGRLRALAEGGSGLPGTVDAARVADGHRLALLFSGQGSHRPAMGRELHRAFPAFAAAFDAAVEACDVGLERSLRDVMWDEHGDLLARTEFAQPAIFAFEVAASGLLRSWGVVPDHLLGHSVGEIAAAHVGGALDLADAAALVTARGRLMQRLAGRGSMVAVAAGEAEVAAELGPGVEIAAVNGPRAVVLSGESAAVRREQERWKQRGARTTVMGVDVPFHSAVLDPVLDELGEVAGRLRPRPLVVPLISSVTGAPMDPDDLTDPSYWTEQARRPVRFADALTSLPPSRRWMTVELGAVPALTGHAMTALGGSAVALATGDRPEPETAARVAAELFVHGVEIDRAGVLAGVGGRTVPLPTYAFRRRRHWIVEPQWASPVVPPAADGAPGPVGTVDPAEVDPVPDADWIRITELAPDRRFPEAVDFVRSRVAATLGHASVGEIEPDRPFAEIGFTSILAVELARRLAVATGTPVEPTTAFDHPTPEAVATMLLAPETAAAPTLARLDRIGRDLAAVDPDSGHAELIRRRLSELLRSAPAAPSPGAPAPTDDLSDEELFRALDDLEMGTTADG